MEKPDTIAAVATPPGRGAIAIIRLSGPTVESMLRPLLGREPEARRAVLGDFLDGEGSPIDQGLALYFPAPRSYTGEAMLELHGHGGIAVQQALLRRCVDLGARLAEPGEFTHRAYLNGKLDLAQAESVADLIDAASQAAVRSAVRSLKGEFSTEIQRLVDGIVELRAYVEASIDFPEEGLDSLKVGAVRDALTNLQGQLDRVTRAAQSGSVLREGATIVLAGPPNVGKSSLLNRLAGEEVAIVTPVAGTTRDAISAQIVIGGVPIWVTDTAGLRDSEDIVESIGVARSREHIRKADLVLSVIDITQPHGESFADGAIEQSSSRLVVENKIDLSDVPPGACLEGEVPRMRVSALTGAGIEELREEILRIVGFSPLSEGVFLARERHLVALRAAQEHLTCAAAILEQSELLAEELRQAQLGLGVITGEYSSDDLLGEIFSRFCIGK